MKLMQRLLVVSLAAGLTACGNTSDIGVFHLIGDAAKQRVAQNKGGTASDPAAVAEVRARLAASGLPVIAVADRDLGYSGLMSIWVPARDGVETWASASQQSLSLRDGIVVATRGFGPDIMASQAPDLQQISAAKGDFVRVYEYLDGDDQTQRVTYQCSFAPGGSETVTVLGQDYATRLVIESCTSDHGSTENRFWFDSSGKLRQSAQMLTPGKSPLIIQRVMG